MTSSTEHHATLEACIRHAGIRDALRYLNSLTAYRYTAIYRFAGDTSACHALFDRIRPDATCVDDVPLSATYCVFLSTDAQALVIADTHADGAEARRRLDEGRAKQVVRAYCGMPIVDAAGEVTGSVCHFDLVPRPRPAVSHLQLMQRLGTYVQPPVVRPGGGFRSPRPTHATLQPG